MNPLTVQRSGRQKNRGEGASDTNGCRRERGTSSGLRPNPFPGFHLVWQFGLAIWFANLVKRFGLAFWLSVLKWSLAFEMELPFAILKWSWHLPFGILVKRLEVGQTGRRPGRKRRRGECRGGEWGENAGEEEEEEEDQGVRIQLNNMCNYDSNESR